MKKLTSLTDFIIDNYMVVIPAIKYYKIIHNTICIARILFKMYHHIFNVMAGLSLIFYIIV